MIPKIIHQIWIGDKDPPMYWISSFQTEFCLSNPDWKYILHTTSEILDNFNILKQLYDKIPERNYCHKADILRLGILKLHGGVYVDADTTWLPGRSFESVFQNPDNKKYFICGKEKDRDIYANGVIGCTPNHPLLDAITEEIKINLDKNPEHIDYNITGPGPFTVAINKNLDKVHIVKPEIFYPDGWHYQESTKRSIDNIMVKYPHSIMVQHGYTTNNLNYNSKTKTTKNNLNFMVPEHWHWKDYPEWENGTFNVFDNFAKGKNTIDIGGWIGCTTMYLSKICPRVVSIEPNPEDFITMKKIIYMNNMGNTHLLNRALCDRDDIIPMHFNNHSSSSLVIGNNRDYNGTVQGISVDSLEKRLKNIGMVPEFVKMDIEGGEKLVIPLLIDFFKKYKPVFFVSLHPMFISHDDIKNILIILNNTFDRLLEVDTVTPFNINRNSYRYGEHGGCDVLCLWN